MSNKGIEREPNLQRALEGNENREPEKNTAENREAYEENKELVEGREELMGDIERQRLDAQLTAAPKKVEAAAKPKVPEKEGFFARMKTFFAWSNIKETWEEEGAPGLLKSFWARLWGEKEKPKVKENVNENVSATNATKPEEYKSTLTGVPTTPVATPSPEDENKEPELVAEEEASVEVEDAPEAEEDETDFIKKPEAYLDLSQDGEAVFQLHGKQKISFKNKLIRIGDRGFRIKAQGYPLSFESVEPNPNGSFHFIFKATAALFTKTKEADLTVENIRDMLAVLETNQAQDEFKHVVTIPGDDTYNFEFKAV